MASIETDIYVYADWKGLEKTTYIGKLSVLRSKGNETYSFEYDQDWIDSKPQFLLDPELNWYMNKQYPSRKSFGIFLDSMPDRWGRVLMQTREAHNARKNERNKRTLQEFDYLLGVHDSCRMGALRFKKDKKGPFLDDNSEFPTPPWSSLKELQYSAKIVQEGEDPEIEKHLARLIAPGSSLGGARPKANILDDDKHPWIAKFPAKNDDHDKAKWEYLAHVLAIKANIKMSECNIEKVSKDYFTFLTKRFDREGGKRIHFASAMTMTENDEDTVRDTRISYLEIADFIQHSSKATTAQIKADLHELWRRIVFHIAISNTDDHLRNHGFIIKDNVWRLSPAYDINPSIDKTGLALNIDMDDNSLDFNLAKSVGVDFFQLTSSEMDDILKEVKSAVSTWNEEATKIGISSSEQRRMEGAFRF
ncbi:MAG: type II toxin-antitoxin system HipA family toxin [Aureispira sp.]